MIVFPNVATESVRESDGISLPVAVFAIDARSVTATADYPEHAPQATAETRAFYEAQTSEPIEHPTDSEALIRLERG